MTEAAVDRGGARSTEAEGPAAPPRSNGELVFEAPWESRAFGARDRAAERRRCDWEEFRGRLIAEIGAWEREHGDDPTRAGATTSAGSPRSSGFSSTTRLLAEAEIEARAAALARGTSTSTTTSTTTTITTTTEGSGSPR